MRQILQFLIVFNKKVWGKDEGQIRQKGIWKIDARIFEYMNQNIEIKKNSLELCYQKNL